MPIDIDRHDAPDGARLAVRGEIDMTTSDRVERELLAAEAAGPATLTLDLTGVAFMDSTALQLILDADRRAREAGRRIVVAAGDGEAARVLGLADVARHLTAAVIE